MSWSSPSLMVPYQQLFIENLHIPTSTSNGTAIMKYLQSTVWSVPYSIGPKKLLHKTTLGGWTSSYQTSPISMQIPQMGIEQNRDENKSQETVQNKNQGLRGNINTTKRRTHITVPYIKGLGESVKNICKRYGIQVFFKGGKTIKDLLMAPKDRDLITQKSGIIYRYKCDRVECEDEYIGESARTFGERFKEHLKTPSPIHDHTTITGHDTTIDNFTIVGREEHNFIRLIKEAIYIRVNNPSLNRNVGKYHLPHVWDEVLNNITELKLK